MPYETHVYYASNLMIALFVAAVILGLVIGYFLWGAKRVSALDKEQQAAELQERLDALRVEGRELRDEIRMVG